MRQLEEARKREAEFQARQDAERQAMRPKIEAVNAWLGVEEFEINHSAHRATVKPVNGVRLLNAIYEKIGESKP